MINNSQIIGNKRKALKRFPPSEKRVFVSYFLLSSFFFALTSRGSHYPSLLILQYLLSSRKSLHT